MIRESTTVRSKLAGWFRYTRRVARRTSAPFPARLITKRARKLVQAMVRGQDQARQSTTGNPMSHRHHLLPVIQTVTLPRINVPGHSTLLVSTEEHPSSHKARGLELFPGAQTHHRLKFRVKGDQDRHFHARVIDEAHLLQEDTLRPVTHRGIRFAGHLDEDFFRPPDVDHRFIKGPLRPDDPKLLVELGQKSGHCHHHEPVHAGNGNQGENPKPPQ